MKTNDLPDYFTLIRVARYLNVPPWELAEKPYYWYVTALNTMEAEAEFEHYQQTKGSKKKRFGGR